MIDYPPDFPSRARARVERTAAKAELDRAAPVSFVLQVFEAFVWELTELVQREPDRWPAERLRPDTAGVLDRLIKHVYWEYPQSVRLPDRIGPSGNRVQQFSDASWEDLNGFTAEVHDALRQYEFWRNLQQNIVILADAADQDAVTAEPALPPAAAVAPTPAELSAPAAPAESSVAASARGAAATGKSGPAATDAAKPQSGSPKQEALKIRDAAKVLGVHPDTIRRMGKRGEIEIIGIGPKLKRVPKSEIARLRTTGKRPANDR